MGSWYTAASESLSDTDWQTSIQTSVFPSPQYQKTLASWVRVHTKQAMGSPPPTSGPTTSRRSRGAATAATQRERPLEARCAAKTQLTAACRHAVVPESHAAAESGSITRHPRSAQSG